MRNALQPKASVSVTQPEVGNGKPQASHAPDRHEPHNTPAPPLLGPVPVLSAAEGAIQYVPQGPGIGKKFDLEKQPLTPELKAKGISEEDYAAICELLRTAFGLTGIDGSFSKAITKANEEYFEKVGCVACYAEYYKGCKVLSPALVLILALALIRALALTLKAVVVASKP